MVVKICKHTKKFLKHKISTEKILTSTLETVQAKKEIIALFEFVVG